MIDIEWEKKGLIYCPDGSGYFKTHAARPIPVQIDDKRLRLYYSSRDHDDRMLPTYIDVSLDDPSGILHINESPLVELGAPGTFDDSGVTLGSIVEHKGRMLLYYTGWKRRRVVSFELSIGLLHWDRFGADIYTRYSSGPLLAQDINHPLLVAGPYVLLEDGLFRMWYCSGTEWRFPDDRPEPIYTVFYAESADGVTWTPRERPVINYKFDGEVVSAPWVLKVGDRYYMWYSTRGHETAVQKHYTIGVAESIDGLNWTRHDEHAGLSRSASGWDSEMVCYPAFFPYRDRIYMFYSGNGVGRGGMGYAVADNFLNG